VQHLTRRTPRSCGLPLNRWTLTCLQLACPFLRELSIGGAHRLLERLDVVWKRARASVRSPDVEYEAKLAYLERLRQQSAQAPERIILAYLDEVTIERQPTLAAAFTTRGPSQPLAHRSQASDTLTRVVATLTHGTGRVLFRRASKIRLSTLVQFYQELCAAYPRAECIYVVQDNWPVHTHPDLLVALQKQTSPFTFHRPQNWPTEPSAAAQQRYGSLQLPIQIVPLPTYASWCNPIEKLWRKLRQQLTHLHPWADDLERLRAEIDQFLNLFADGSASLLRYVGLGKSSWPAIPD
jgi:hypothetical protein